MSWVKRVAYNLQLTGRVQGMHNVSFLHPYLCGGTHKGPPGPIVAGENQEYKIKRKVTHEKIKIRTVY